MNLVYASGNARLQICDSPKKDLTKFEGPVLFYSFFIQTKSGGSIFMFTSQTDVCRTTILYLWKLKLEWLLPPVWQKGRKQKTWDFTRSHHTGCVCTMQRD